MTVHSQYQENLPLYAVGALPREESEALDRHLAECAGCREELRALSDATAQIAMAVDPLLPPARLREQLAARLQDEQLRVATRDSRPVSASPLRSIWFWFPAFGVVILAVAFAAVWMRNRELSRAYGELAAELESSKAATQEARNLVNMLSASDAQRVTLVAAGTEPQPQAKAVYSLRHRSLVLLASNLNPLPARKTYELWLLPANGTPPLPVGTFRPDAGGSATLVLPQFSGAVPAKGFAVTIEKVPGSATPTLPIVLSGSS